MPIPPRSRLSCQGSRKQSRPCDPRPRGTVRRKRRLAVWYDQARLQCLTKEPLSLNGTQAARFNSLGEVEDAQGDSKQRQLTPCRTLDKDEGTLSYTHQGQIYN